MKTALWLAGALIVVSLAALWKHDSDARRDGRIEELTKRVTQDSVVVDSLTKASQKAETATVAALDTFARHDTVWSRHRDTVTATVDRIVHDTLAPDSAKIVALAALVDTTQQKADSAIKAAEAVARAAQASLLSFDMERAAWTAERADRATEISLLKKQSRHWGLCATGGYGPQREHDGAVRFGWHGGVAVCYRY